MTSLYRGSSRTLLRTALASSSTPIASSSKLRLTSSRVRFNSHSASTPASPSAPSPSSATATESDSLETSSSSSTGATPVRYTYFVPRVGKTMDSFPVYTDVRNGGTRTLTELRKIQGSLQDLKTDLTLFLADTYHDNHNAAAPWDKPNRKPLRPKPGRKLINKSANPSYLDPVLPAKVAESAKLKIKGNRVEQVKAFLQSRGF